MVIKSMIRNNICMNAHPEGCRQSVLDQIEYVRRQSPISGPSRVLIIGASAGYGLASRIVSAFACRALTVGVAFEKPASGRRTATPGWYNTACFEEQARAEGLMAETLFGDAFADDTRRQTIEIARRHQTQFDMVIYSLASGMRQDPRNDQQYRSVLKPIGEQYRAKSIEPLRGTVNEVTIEPAQPGEIEATIKVMGGEDWKLWIEALLEADVLAPGARTIAYSYIGPALTKPIYRDGTIGKAKEHLEKTAGELQQLLATRINGLALISINKALVTRASAVIPVVPLYLAILFKVMKQKKLHEGCIEQIYRLFAHRLYAEERPITDNQGRIRLDDWEMRDDVQQAVVELWPQIDQTNVKHLTDIAGYTQDFLQIHGFGYPHIDYDRDVEA